MKRCTVCNRLVRNTDSLTPHFDSDSGKVYQYTCRDITKCGVRKRRKLKLPLS